MPWKPSYATAADLAGHLGVAVDGEMSLACETASRAIDHATGRQFGVLSTAEARWYPAECRAGQWSADIDDLMTTTGLTVETATGDPVTEYRLTPRNAAPLGRPWTRLELFTRAPDGVKVTARWGWTAVPEPVKLATLIQAARLYERRRNVAGPLTSERVDDVSYSYHGGAADLDADADAIIAPYRKLWAAV
jgi:hypothetical protein